jgi:TolB protein
MKRKANMRNLKLKVLVTVCCIAFFIVHCFLIICDAKIYIDISSPGFRKVPIAIQEFIGPHGKEISEIIRNDLEFTGLFASVDKAAYLEKPSDPFNRKNWTPLGIETVLKGTSAESKDLDVTATLYDVYGGEAILKHEYRTNKAFMRLLSHTISNDIYYLLTGNAGIFKTRIAFIGEEKGEKSLYLIDWDGGGIKKTSLKANILLSLRWSRDGSELIYSAERNRQWGIYLLDFKNMSERKVFSSGGTNIAGDFFPKGDEIILSSSKEGNPDLYKVHLKSGNALKLTSTYGIEVSPSVSPDGERIAFVSDRGGSPQIYVMRRDGSGAKRITFEGAYNTSPNWSPKGDKIVFASRRGTNQICIINPDGTGVTQLTTQGNNEDPSFSPDGRYITFSSDRDGVKGIYIMRANGESEKRITPRSIRAFSPRWSPN